MMKFKIGQRVRVRSDLELNTEYCMEDRETHNAFVSGMEYLRGKCVTIKNYDGGQYVIEEEGFLWTDEMFEETVVKIDIDKMMCEEW